MNLILRAATAEDQAAITQMIRAEHLNPFDLGWRNFVVIEEVTANAASRRIIGIGQLRPRDREAQELASLVVAADQQGRGLGILLVHTLMARAAGPLYLMCRSEMLAYYRRFGFIEVKNPRAMPKMMARFYRIGQTLAPLAGRLTGEAPRPAVMVLPRTYAVSVPVHSAA